jgi:hypothetical protein
MRNKVMGFLIVLFLLASGAVVSQSVSSIIIPQRNHNESYLSGELYKPDILPDITTYFNSDWLSGDILMSDGTLKSNEKIKYNGLLDELFWLEPESRQTIKLDKGAILRFHYYNYQGDTSVYFRKLKVKRNTLNDSIEIFGQELFRGELSLYLLHSFYFARTTTVHVNKRDILKDIYEKDPVYYIGFQDKKIVGLKRFSRKNIYAAFPDKIIQIRKFISENYSGRIKTTDEIISLIQFVNSIGDKTDFSREP